MVLAPYTIHHTPYTYNATYVCVAIFFLKEEKMKRASGNKITLENADKETIDGNVEGKRIIIEYTTEDMSFELTFEKKL